jgi:hypothetical protein
MEATLSPKRRLYIALTGWALLQRRNVFLVRYEVRFYIPEDGILHSHRCENFKSYLFGVAEVLGMIYNASAFRVETNIVEQIIN